MPKNKNGGNKSKALANKHEHESIILPQPPEQYFAFVSKVLGNGLFHVSFLSYDTLEPLLLSSIAHLRGKMKGSHKRNHFVSLHSFLIISIRDFSSTHCDILHVFHDNQIPSLRNNPHFSLLASLMA